MSFNKQLAIVKITGLANLQIVNLSYTSLELTSINAPLLRTFRIDYSYVQIFSLIWAIGFEYVISLEELSLRYIGVEMSALYDNVNNISCFRGLHNLTYLSLKGNRLRLLEPNMFRDLCSLILFDLQNSGIEVIPSGTFRGLESLQTIFLDGNLIQQLTSDLFRDLPQLRYLTLRNNQIYYLDMNMFEYNSVLTILYLANNHLAGFNRSTFEPIVSSVGRIDLSGNPIICDCDLMWFAEWLSGPNIQLTHERETICSPVSATLAPLRGKPLMMLANTDLCYPQALNYVCIIFSIITVVIFLVLTYWHRWFLRHKLFLLKLAIIGYKEIEDHRNREEFEYDLNIMFTNDCEEWLQQHLRPFLDESFPDMGRMVFGDDNLRLGMHYLDAVLYAVEHSFKTVIVLSRAAVQDHWFMLKFRLAMDYATDMGTENIILIFVEDVYDDDELPYLVRLFLSGSGSYLNWGEDEEGQDYFWKQLEKYFNVNRRINHLLPAH